MGNPGNHAGRSWFRGTAMMPPGSSGYSRTPLPRKLSIGPGSKVLLVGAPAGLDIGPLPAEVVLDAEQTPAATLAAERARSDDVTGYDVVLFFTASQRELAACFQALAERLTSAGTLWVCWPKRASGVHTDMTENAVRSVALPRG